MAEIYVEWQKLCEEHDTARDAYFDAFAAVNQKFAAIAKGSSRANPTERELDEFESAWKRWEAVKRRMDEFVKKNA